MGYTTEFSGQVNIEPPLNEHEISFLNDLSSTRRMKRTKGPLFVRGSGSFGQGRDDDVLDHNRANGESSYIGEPAEEENGQPGLWCQWVPTDDGTTLEWDGGEKFYHAAEWMKYIVTNLLSGESAKVYVGKHRGEDERLEHFTFDHVVNGTIHAQGEDTDDRWILVVEDSVVKVSDAEITYKNPQPI